MKNLLKFIIAIAIVIGIVLGVRYFINNSPSQTRVYDDLSNAKAVETLSKVEIEKDLDKLYSYIEGEYTSVNVTSQITTSVSENGEFYSLRIVMQNCEDLFNYYYTQSALTTKTTKNLQQEVLNSFNQLKSEINKQKKSTNDLTEGYLEKVDRPNKNDFNAKFDAMVEQYKSTIKAYSKFLYQFNEYILNDTLSNNKVSANFIYSEICTKINYQASLKEGLLADNIRVLTNAKKILNLTGTDLQEFVLNYNAIDNLEGFMVSTTKDLFIKDLANKANYEYIKAFLYA